MQLTPRRMRRAFASLAARGCTIGNGALAQGAVHRASRPARVPVVGGDETTPAPHTSRSWMPGVPSALAAAVSHATAHDRG